MLLPYTEYPNPFKYGIYIFGAEPEAKRQSVVCLWKETTLFQLNLNNSHSIIPCTPAISETKPEKSLSRIICE